MATIGIVDIGATLKRHTIVASAIEMCGSIEVMYLLWLNTSDGVVVICDRTLGSCWRPPIPVEAMKWVF